MKPGMTLGWRSEFCGDFLFQTPSSLCYLEQIFSLQGQGSSKEADSTWTESPSERGKPKAVVPNGAEAKHTKERDAKQQEVADSINVN